MTLNKICYNPATTAFLFEDDLAINWKNAIVESGILLHRKENLPTTKL
jgi:hypothetical protein